MADQRFYDDLQRNYMRAKRPQPTSSAPDMATYSPTMAGYSPLSQVQHDNLDGNRGHPNEFPGISGHRLMPQRMMLPNVQDSERAKFYRSERVHRDKYDDRLNRDVEHYDQVGDMFDEYRQQSTRMSPQMREGRKPIVQTRGSVARRRFRPRQVNLTSHGYRGPYDPAMFADRGGEEEWMFW